MFGTVNVNKEELNEEERLRYRGFYCGLCRTLGERYGLSGRLCLTFDCTFLAMMLSSLSEPEETVCTGRCAPHPFKVNTYVTTRFTEYAAAMNVMLAFFNCMDDWIDEKKFLHGTEALLLQKKALAVGEAYPRQWTAVKDGVAALAEAEKRRCGPDEAANLFGALLGELFVFDPGDRWAGDLRRFGEGLGRFIYLCDAVCDLKKDVRRGRFNPFADRAGDPAFPEESRELLTSVIGEAAQAFERLPLVQDAGILRNILYSGIWTGYYMQRDRRQKETNV